MKKKVKRILSLALSGVMMLACLEMQNGISSVLADDIPIRETVENNASDNTIIIGVEGLDCTSDMQTLLNRINQIRKEACEQHVPDPRNTSRNLSYPEDYVPLKIGQYCTEQARIRSAEAAIYLGHVRPNGSACQTILSSLFPSNQSWGENLAWNGDMSSDIEGWIDEKNDWIQYKDDPNSGKMVGHYSTLIDPSINYTGMATFNPTYDSAPYNWSCTAGAYAKTDVEVTSLPGAQNTKYIQKMEIFVNKVTDGNVVGDSICNVNTTVDYKLQIEAKYSGLYANTVIDCPVYDGVTWSSSDTGIVEIDADGKATIKKSGKAKITASIGTGSNKKQFEKSIVVIANGVTVKSVSNPAVVETESFKTPSLSKTATATLSNGDTVEVDTEWTEYDTSKLQSHFSSIYFDVNGKAGDYDVVQRVHVKPANILEVRPVYHNSSTHTETSAETVTTDSGTRISEPVMAIDLSNGYTWYYPVNWDKDGINHYKDREGGKFTVNGTTSVPSDTGSRSLSTSFELVVKKATITKVEFKGDGATIQTISGTPPTYPTATVTWSNKDVTEEDIIWEDAEPSDSYVGPNDTSRKYMMREGGNYTLNGTYNEQNTSVTINVLSATAKSATITGNQSVISAIYGENPGYKLPKEASVLWSNGDRTSENIEWESQDSSNYNVKEGNTYTTVGDVCGLTVTATVNVAAIKMKSASVASSVSTPRKKEPTLPEKAHVVWADNSETDEEVEWNSINSSQYATAGTSFDVTGNVTGYAGDTKTVTTTVNVTERALTGIEWANGGPTKAKSKYTYKASDVEGNIIVTYDNGDTETIAVNVDGTTMKLDGFNANSTAASQSVRLAYTEAGITQYTSCFNMQLITRKGIKVSQNPKTTFIEGQAFSFSGIKLKSVLSDGTEEDANATLTSANFSGYNMNPTSYGKQTVTVTWGGKSCTYDITVNKKKLTGLTLVSGPSTTEYLAGIHQPSVAGIVVNGQYDNGTTSSVNITASNLRVGCTAANPAGSTWNTSTAGTYDVYVVVQNDAGESIKTDSFKMYVYDKTVESISVKTKPTELSVPQNLVGFTGFADGVLTANCNCNYTEDISFSNAGVSISGFDISQIGEQTVTVSYGDKSTSFKATVTEPVLQSTTVTPPTKTSYTQGDAVSMAGAKIVKTYDNGRTEEIDLSQSADVLSTAGVEVVFRDANGNEYPVNDASITTSTGAKTLVVKYKDPITGTVEELAMSNGAAVSVNVSQKPAPTQPSNSTVSTNKSTGSTGKKSTGTTQKSSTPKSTTPKYKNEWRNGKWYGADGKTTYSGTLSWKSNSKGWWVEDSAGWYPQDQWQKIDGIWYYFKPDGYMASCEYYKGYWFNSDGSWDPQYKLSWKSNATGWWVEDISGWWPSNKWLKVDGDWYYFNGSGYMATSQYVDGYWLAANGVCQ